MPTLRLGRVLGFILATFALSWGVSSMIDSVAGAIIPLGMFFPAFTALIMETYFIEESPLYRRSLREPAMLVPFGFISFTILALLLSLGAPYFGEGVTPSLGSVLFVLWTLLVIQVYRRTGEDSFKSLGLQLGDTEKGVPFVAGIVVFFILQAGLNMVFGLGEFKGVQSSIEGIPIPPVLYPFVLIAFFVLAFVGGPLGNLAATFGEEYGWRGFLHRELAPLGLRKGVLVTGIIWATWHIPVINSGIHTYPPTATGYLMAYVFFTLWSFIQTYSVLKTGSVWTPAFLHGVVNSVYAYTLRYLVRPDVILYSFGLGAYGLVCLFIVVVFILRDPVWNSIGSGDESYG
jgi:membrane protease YdiL (CAAX protease family)